MRETKDNKNGVQGTKVNELEDDAQTRDSLNIVKDLDIKSDLEILSTRDVFQTF